MCAELRASRPRYERQTSAGGVVYRRRDEVMEVLLCGRREPPLWALPKGTPNPGEGIRATALREVNEETGVEVEIERKLGAVRYFFMRVQDNTRCDKTVHHYLMRPLRGDTSHHDQEFDEVHWFLVDAAIAIMTYPNEANMVRKAREVVEGKQHLRPLGKEHFAESASTESVTL